MSKTIPIDLVRSRTATANSTVVASPVSVVVSKPAEQAKGTSSALVQTGMGKWAVAVLINANSK